jgi:deoxycytidine triphosphate deaminase
MILSGQDIKRFGLLLNAKDSNYQAQGCDIRVEKVFKTVNKPFGEKIVEEDYVEPVVQREKMFKFNCTAQVWGENDKFLYYWIPPESAVLFKIMETADLTPKLDTIGDVWEESGRTWNNIQHITRYFNAYILPKSSLSRRGIIVHSAWWDAGYKGSGFVLVKTTDNPLKIKPGAEFAQMVFLEGTPTERVYEGQYQGENLSLESCSELIECVSS